jgi:hypothetical protein
MLTTDQKGAFAESMIAAVAIGEGVGVSRPLTDERYDLIFDVGERLWRIQCQWAVKLNDVVVIRCRRVRRGPEGLIRRTYLPGEIDAVAAYCAAIDACFFLPAAVSIGRDAIQLRLAPTKNNQAIGIRWARDFELRATLQQLHGPIAQLGERLSGTQKVAGSSPAGST